MQRHERSVLCMALLACPGDERHRADFHYVPGVKGNNSAHPLFPLVKLQANYKIKLSG